MPTLIFLAAAATSVGLIAFGWALSGNRSASSPRALGRSDVDLRAIELRKGIGSRAVNPIVRWLSIRARRLTPIGMVETMGHRIHLAGLGERMTLEQALALKSIIASVGAAFGIFYLMQGSVFTGVAIIAVGYFALDIILWSRARERQALIARALPDTMDQLKISVEAGLGFDAALDRISRQPGPLAREFALITSEIQLGTSRKDALRNLVNRTNVPELRRFVAAMTHAEGFGIPIAQVLRVQAEDLRDKRRMRAQEKAQRIPILIIFPMLVFIFPTIFIVLLGPAAMGIFEALSGL